MVDGLINDDGMRLDEYIGPVMSSQCSQTERCLVSGPPVDVIDPPPV